MKSHHVHTEGEHHRYPRASVVAADLETTVGLLASYKSDRPPAEQTRRGEYARVVDGRLGKNPTNTCAESHGYPLAAWTQTAEATDDLCQGELLSLTR